MMSLNKCTVDECIKPVAGQYRKMCSMHLARKNRLGSATVLVREQKHIITDVHDGLGTCSTDGVVEVYWRNSGKWQGWACRVAMRKQKKRAQVKANFGISLEQYEEWFDKADYKCQLCGGDFRLSLDHDHITGKIRGVLCFDCNTSIGKLGDSIEGLKKALAYLEERS
jgi:recombination endonuclease VII